MFLKRLERRKSGKGHTYWALVESYRTAGGSRHRVVAYLGQLKKSERNGWAQFCQHLTPQERPQPSLFDPPHYDEPAEDEPLLVKLKDIRLERLRDFGDVWLALGLWRLLQLDELLTRHMPQGAEDIPWPVVAAILTIERGGRDTVVRIYEPAGPDDPVPAAPAPAERAAQQAPPVIPLPSQRPAAVQPPPPAQPDAARPMVPAVPASAAPANLDQTPGAELKGLRRLASSWRIAAPRPRRAG